MPFRSPRVCRGFVGAFTAIGIGRMICGHQPVRQTESQLTDRREITYFSIQQSVSSIA
jgi:hypothetical protein